MDSIQQYRPLCAGSRHCGCDGLCGKFVLSEFPQRKKVQNVLYGGTSDLHPERVPRQPGAGKTYLAGPSMGGYGAWFLAPARPDLCAKAASMSGAPNIAGLRRPFSDAPGDAFPFQPADSFGDIDHLTGSEYGLFALYDRAASNSPYQRRINPLDAVTFSIRPISMSEWNWKNAVLSRHMQRGQRTRPGPPGQRNPAHSGLDPS